MSKPKVSIKIDLRRFQRAIPKHRGALSEIAEWCGVSRQAVNNWLKNGSLPPKALAVLAEKLGWNASDITEITAPQQSENERRLVVRQAKAMKEIFRVLAEFIECPNCGRMARGDA